MKLQLERHLLTALLALTLTGLTACSRPSDGNRQPVLPAVSEQSPSESSMPADSSQAVTPATGSFDCAGADPHPIGQSIAATYEVSYEQVMSWFCEGYSFENILIALETGEAVDLPADTLLQMLQEKEWEDIWVEVGFTGEQ